MTDTIKDSETIEYYSKFIRDRITQLRLKKGVSEREMSLSLGKASSYIRQITSGKILPLMANFIDICDYLEVSPAEFFIADNDKTAEIQKLISCVEKYDECEIERLYGLLKRLTPEEVKFLLDIIYKTH